MHSCCRWMPRVQLLSIYTNLMPPVATENIKKHQNMEPDRSSTKQTYSATLAIYSVIRSQQWLKPGTIFSTNANNVQNVFYNQNTCTKHTTPQNGKHVRGWESAWSERRMETCKALGSVLTNSILCCCSCFHGAPAPSLLLVPSRSVCLSPHTHKRSFTHTQVFEMGFSHVSKSASNRCSERESIILHQILHLTIIPGILPAS